MSWYPFKDRREKDETTKHARRREDRKPRHWLLAKPTLIEIVIIVLLIILVVVVSVRMLG